MSVFAQEIEEAETVARVIKHEGGRARPCNAAKLLIGAAPPLGCICRAEQLSGRKSKKHQNGVGPKKLPDVPISLQMRKSRPREGDRPAQEHTASKRPRKVRMSSTHPRRVEILWEEGRFVRLERRN